MTPTELRALADALEPLASLGRSGSQGALALESTIAYLRAQADAQPVAWIAHNLTTGHVKWTTDRCRAHGWIQGGNLRVKSLYAHPAPQSPSDASHIYRPTSDAAQPQTEPSEFKFQPRAGALARSWDRADALAEPKEENNVWKQIIPDDAPQAEPKREPNPDEVICPACTHQFRAIPENVQKQLWAKREPPHEFAQWVRDSIPPNTIILDPDWWAPRLWRVAMRAHGIGGSDE